MPVYTYTTLDDPSATNGTVANGINDSGQIVGDYVGNSPITLTHGFLYDPSSGTYTTLDDPLASHNTGGGTITNAVNGTGEIEGASANGGSMMDCTRPGIVIVGGTYTTIDDPLATNGTIANGINASGQIVGFYSNATGHGFLLSGGTNGTYTTLDDPLSMLATFAQDINDAGQIVGGYNNAT